MYIAYNMEGPQLRITDMYSPAGAAEKVAERQTLYDDLTTYSQQVGTLNKTGNSGTFCV